MKQSLLKFFILSGMLMGFPMLGVFLADLPVRDFLEFPPETMHVAHAPSSWGVFILFCLIILLGISPLFFCFEWKKPSQKDPWGYAASFPWWGWAGMVLGMVAWIMAWNRFPWFAPLQPHTFTPLWLSYILVINGLTYRQTGSCLMVAAPGYFWGLFPLSAIFWWFFEYLNRFVQNWYYTGAHFNALEYFFFATLPFSTVLPAVLSTTEWIHQGCYLEVKPKTHLVPKRLPPRFFALFILMLSGSGLICIGIWPDVLFPLLWISPLLIILSLQSLMGESQLFSDGHPPDWRRILSATVAALFCGFFWEMWNFYSMAKWKYSIPFVHRFQIFEMPLLGYAGYLPFGLECLVVGQMFEKVLKKN